MTESHRIYGHNECDVHMASAFFESVASELVAFAVNHRLTIWRYPHRAPMWLFHFLHPAGGFGWLQLSCWQDEENVQALRAGVSVNWYVDDHQKRLRRQYAHGAATEVQATSEEVVRILEKQLNAVLRATAEDLVPTDLYVPTGERTSDFEQALQVPLLDGRVAQQSVQPDRREDAAPG